MENNKAICRKTDEHFTEGKEYECTSAYAKCESAVVDILDNNKEFVTVEINDKDFQFIFNYERIILLVRLKVGNIMEIKNYLPKRIRDRVVRVDVEADFDYEKNRSVQHYFVTLDDGTTFDATTIKELKETANRIESKSK